MTDSVRSFSVLVLLILINYFLSFSPAVALAAKSGDNFQERSSCFIQELARNLDLRGEIGFDAAGEKRFSIKPGNVGIISRRQFKTTSVKVDMSSIFNQIEIGVKPRWEWDTQGEGDFFINEWFAKYMLRDDFFILYGREILQWGPSCLLSPSNPFSTDNGRDNPKRELAGSDFGRIVWIPSYEWTVSFIANTDKGRRTVPEFKKAYALKADYTGQEKYFSMVFSHREPDRSRIGFFGSWTAFEALVLYAEGSMWEFDNDTKVILGASYTPEMGCTITVEYFYNEEGNANDPIYSCLLRANSIDTLLRQNYILLQYIDIPRLNDSLHLTLRGILNLDDESSKLIGVAEYDLGNYTQLFGVGSFSLRGDKDSEFGIVDYSVMGGIRFSF
ncbi:MAG: hypothetical protein ABIK26_06160 [Candidatus Omnitrophota bacterium]